MNSKQLFSFLLITILALKSPGINCQDLAHQFWKSTDITFMKFSNSIWIEFDKDVSSYQYTYFSSDNDNVYLYSNDRKFYMKLTPTSACWGYTLTTTTNCYVTGGWFPIKSSTR